MRHLSEPDRTLLGFAAEHRLILPAHAGALLGICADAAARRLRRLTGRGHLRADRQLSPPCYLIDRSGLHAIGSDLPRPRDVDLATYAHDVGLAWLWLAAHRGAFGAPRRVISERRMRSADRRREAFTEPFGVRALGRGPHGGERLHYPDLLLETRGGHRVALELELTPKGRTRRERILGGYAADPKVDAVVYAVRDRRVGAAVRSSAAAVGISQIVHVREVSLAAPVRVTAAPGGSLTRARASELGR